MNQNAKQKNKPFKGSKKRSQSHKVGATKKIAKVEKDYKKDERKKMLSQMQEKRKQDNENVHKKVLVEAKLTNQVKESILKEWKSYGQVKIMLLVPMNEQANT